MIRISQITVSPDQKPEKAGKKELEKKIRKRLRLPENAEFEWQIVKSSIDARKKPEILIHYTVDVTVPDEKAVFRRCKDKSVSMVEPVCYHFPVSGKKELSGRPVIVGTGPAGLFCGYMLAVHGYRPILLERGQCVDDRCVTVEKFWKSGVLDTECNVQFGEGGAGTFSDGKLNTLVKDKEGRNREVLRIFVEAGAPASILYEGKPHIGTDVLVDVVKRMRQTILAYGGEVRFQTKMTKLLQENGRITGVLTQKGERLETGTVVLAIGHSARDTFQMLYDSQVPMEAKAFAVGLRVEHPQRMINRVQYGREHPEHLPPAVYKLAAQTSEGRGVYSFCMCPGGYVVNASSEAGRLAVNGMSYSKRNGENANSAIVVSVTPEDYGSSHPLSGLTFQRRLEEKAFEVAAGKVPVERYGEFKQAVMKQAREMAAESSGLDGKMEDPGRLSGRHPGETDDSEGRRRGRSGEDLGEYLPQVRGQWQFAPVHCIMPDALNHAFVEGMEAFGRIMDGFSSDQALLSGIESRTSSPVRIHRDASGQSQIRGLYPCGEGAGYAGGITSAAMDGIRMAERIAGEYKPLVCTDGGE